MDSFDEYRTQAEDCLRMAETQDEQDRSLWVTLAQSWLRLAEDADRIKSGQPVGEQPGGESTRSN
jgi:hypothetical protein